MSLEAKISELTEVMKEHNDLLREMISGAKGAGGDKAATGRGRKKKDADEDTGTKGGDDDDASGDKVDPDALKKTLGKVAKWLDEFKDDENDPESDARREALGAALEKIGAEKVSKLTTEEQRTRVETWLAKKIDGGRLTEEPKKVSKKKADDDEI